MHWWRLKKEIRLVSVQALEDIATVSVDDVASDICKMESGQRIAISRSASTSSFQKKEDMKSLFSCYFRHIFGFKVET